MTERVVYFSFEQFSHRLPLKPDQIIEIVELGIVDPHGSQPQNWQFDMTMLAQARKACQLHQQLEVDWPGVALALQLLHRLEKLEQENAQLKSHLARFVRL